MLVPVVSGAGGPATVALPLGGKLKGEFGLGSAAGAAKIESGPNNDGGGFFGGAAIVATSLSVTLSARGSCGAISSCTSTGSKWTKPGCRNWIQKCRKIEISNRH